MDRSYLSHQAIFAVLAATFGGIAGAVISHGDLIPGTILAVIALILTYGAIKITND